MSKLLRNFHYIRFFLTEPATHLPLGEVFEAIGGTAFCLFVLLHVPRQLGGDVSDEEAAGPQTVIVAPHSELAVLRMKHRVSNFISQICWRSFFVSFKGKVKHHTRFLQKHKHLTALFSFCSCGTSHISKHDVSFPLFFPGFPTNTPFFRTCLYTTICLWGPVPKGLVQIWSAQFRRWRLRGGGGRR